MSSRMEIVDAPRPDPDDEDSDLGADEVAALAGRIREGMTVELEYAAGGFVATVNGQVWSPYVLLSELLGDLSAAAGTRGRLS